MWVLLTNAWLDGVWTGNPVSVQGPSKPCPMPVQMQVKYKVCLIAVQGLSNACPSLSYLTVIGHENPTFVHTLSNQMI